MMVRGVSVIVSASDRDLVPSVMRAVGSQVSGAGERITVYLNRSQSVQLLRNVAATGRLAVVFSEPSTHRTVQLKARGVRMREAGNLDEPVLQRYLASMTVELGKIGIVPALVAAMLSPDERRSFAEVLSEALSRARKGGLAALQPVAAPPRFSIARGTA